MTIRRALVHPINAARCRLREQVFSAPLLLSLLPLLLLPAALKTSDDGDSATNAFAVVQLGQVLIALGLPVIAGIALARERDSARLNYSARSSHAGWQLLAGVMFGSVCVEWVALGIFGICLLPLAHAAGFLTEALQAQACISLTAVILSAFAVIVRLPDESGRPAATRGVSLAMFALLLLILCLVCFSLQATSGPGWVGLLAIAVALLSDAASTIRFGDQETRTLWLRFLAVPVAALILMPTEPPNGGYIGGVTFCLQGLAYSVAVASIRSAAKSPSTLRAGLAAIVAACVSLTAALGAQGIAWTSLSDMATGDFGLLLLASLAHLAGFLGLTFLVARRAPRWCHLTPALYGATVVAGCLVYVTGYPEHASLWLPEFLCPHVAWSHHKDGVAWAGSVGIGALVWSAVGAVSLISGARAASPAEGSPQADMPAEPSKAPTSGISLLARVSPLLPVLVLSSLRRRSAGAIVVLLVALVSPLGSSVLLAQELSRGLDIRAVPRGWIALGYAQLLLALSAAGAVVLALRRDREAFLLQHAHGASPPWRIALAYLLGPSVLPLLSALALGAIQLVLAARMDSLQPALYQQVLAVALFLLVCWGGAVYQTRRLGRSDRWRGLGLAVLLVLVAAHLSVPYSALFDSESPLPTAKRVGQDMKTLAFQPHKILEGEPPDAATVVALVVVLALLFLALLFTLAHRIRWIEGRPFPRAFVLGSPTACACLVWVLLPAESASISTLVTLAFGASALVGYAATGPLGMRRLWQARLHAGPAGPQAATLVGLVLGLAVCLPLVPWESAVAQVGVPLLLVAALLRLGLFLALYDYLRRRYPSLRFGVSALAYALLEGLPLLLSPPGSNARLGLGGVLGTANQLTEALLPASAPQGWSHSMLVPNVAISLAILPLLLCKRPLNSTPGE